MIGGAGIMLLKQTLDSHWFEQSLLSQPMFPQQFLYQRAQESFQPQGSGDEEAPFFCDALFSEGACPERLF